MISDLMHWILWITLISNTGNVSTGDFGHYSSYLYCQKAAREWKKKFENIEPDNLKDVRITCEAQENPA